MREIKFRAWVTDKAGSDLEHTMWDVFGMDRMRKDLEGRPPYVRLGGHYTIPLESVILMQYTGLKDKNGVEIYEGELLEYPVTSYPLEVIWDDFSCAFMLRDAEGDLMRMPVKEAIAKYSLSIGNIYENKELL